MDLDTSFQPCTSKSIKVESSKMNHNTVANGAVVIIDDDDSLDSAYETGSAVSRSTQSSPTLNTLKATTKSVKNELNDAEKELYFYANIHYERNVIASWPLCLLKCESRATDSKRTHNGNNNSSNNNTIVISDSDDSDCDDVKPPPTPNGAGNGKLNSTMNSNPSSPSSIILLDSDEETEDIVPYHTVEDQFGEIRKIPDYYMAYGYPPNPKQRLPNGLRIIARRLQKHFPMTYTAQGPVTLYHNDDTAFYAGILSCEYSENNGQYHYMVFFDDGHVQYVANENIRVVFGNYGKRYVHENARKFYDYYFYRVKIKRMMEITCVYEKEIMVFLNSRPEMAKMIDFDTETRRGLVLLHFWKSNQIEWLYTGSPRIERIWKLIHKDKQMQQYHQANETLIEVSSDSEDDDECELQSPQKKPLPIGAKDPKQKTIKLNPKDLIDDYKETGKLDRKHICGRLCVREFERNPKIFDFDPLKRPILAGWTRKITGICYYIAPCGRSFNTLEATYKYLRTTRSRLTIDCFSFSSNIECMREVISYNGAGNQYFLNDLITGGDQEKRRIPVVPIADNLPTFREYVIHYRRNPRSKKVPEYLADMANNPFRSGCNCTDDCSNKLTCSCWRLTIGDTKQQGYLFKRLDSRVDTGIYECNPNCQCSSKCLNRVVSARIEQKLELYETKDRGYGLRCQTDLPKGTFVACYFGDILHGKTADERAMKKSGSFHGDEYFMQLDHIEISEEFKEGYEANVTDIENSDSENYAAPSKRLKLNDTLSPSSAPQPANGVENNIISYFPNILNKKAQIEENQRTSLFGENAVEYVVDGRYRGNVARFFNHSCQPNLFSQTVFTDTHDLRFPWISFFTSEDIKAGTELTWDYGYLIGSILGREMLCRCGAKNCRKRLL